MNNLNNNTDINPDDNMVTLFYTKVLVEVVNGRLDLNKLAEIELRNRGLNKQGIWIGFNNPDAW